MSGKDAGSIWVAGHEAEVVRAEGLASVISDLGAGVRLLDLWGTTLDGGATAHEAPPARLLAIEVLDRPDLLQSSLKALRQFDALADAPVLAVVGERSITRLQPGLGYDDFLVWPSRPAELYARIRQLEWRSSAFASDEQIKLGPLMIDIAARHVSLEGAEGGRAIALTAREFGLLVALATRRGRVLSRETLLDVVWGSDYDGGAKTVDVHVRRLRAKLGDALPLQTVRGAGYMIR